MPDDVARFTGMELVAGGLQQVNSVASLDGYSVPGRFLVPGQLCGLTLVPKLESHNFIYVYYISDLHLETWYDGYRKAEEAPVPISEWIETVIDSLFNGNFLQAISNGHNFIVLFLGDIADTFDNSELFYTAFMRKWDMIDKKCRRMHESQEAERLTQKRVARHEADLCVVDEYKASHPWTQQAKRPLVEYKKVPDEIKAAIQRIEQWERGETLDVGTSREFRPSRRNVFAVLGNHEIAGLGADYEQGKQEYKVLFQFLGIHFLDNGILLGKKSLVDSVPLVAGFCGFSDPQLAPDVIGNYEIKIRDELAAWYKECVEQAKSAGRILVFCTHFPLLHGTVDGLCENNVYHFCGHTHRDSLEILSETGAIIADNQIGYGWNSSKQMAFKRIDLYPRYNLFDAYEDGCHEIDVKSYRDFYWYCREQVNTGTMERYLRGVGPFNKPFGDTGRLYMIKSCGYYGFFIAFDKIQRVYLCNGGKPKPLPGVKSMNEALYQFDAMIDAYLQVFSGFRRYQEQIASYIRNFGGNGKIHGLIVDIDFYNHVGIDPVSGAVTFYYSPFFGAMQNYSDMGMLLENHAPELYPAYKQLSASSLVPSYGQDATTESELVSVERGGKSFYGASRYISPVQRLFSCKILRVWDETVLNKAKSAANGQKASLSSMAILDNK